LYSTSVEASSEVLANPTTSHLAAQGLKHGIGALSAQALTHCPNSPAIGFLITLP